MDDGGTIQLSKVPISETWEVLEIIANQDIARFIRVSNVPVRMRYNM
jgi:hypothetical protein